MPISRIIRPNHMIRSSLEPGLSDVANISPNLVSWLPQFPFWAKSRLFSQSALEYSAVVCFINYENQTKWIELGYNNCLHVVRIEL